MDQLKTLGTMEPTILSYLWKIENFTSACKGGQASKQCLIISPIFSTTYSSIEYKWRLLLCPESTRKECKEYVAFYLEYLGCNDVEVNVTLSLLDDKFCKVVQHSIPAWSCRKKSVPHGWSSFTKLNFINDKTNRLLVNDTINVLCEIIYDSNLAKPSLKRRRVEQDLPDYRRLQEFDEFEKLLLAEHSTDVIVKIGKEEIKVHKAIIMSRSPVFQAMFEHDMREKKQSLVEISDIKYGVMKEVFRFMYVGRVNKAEEMASDLLVAADKYSIEGLKVLCEKLLFQSLTVSNAVEFLSLAQMCSAINLKTKIIEFIVHNQTNFVNKSELQLLPGELMYEVLNAVIVNNSNK